MSRFALPPLREKLASHSLPDDPKDDAQAAVAAILRPGPGGAEVLLIKRADREGDPWSGHLAFPGGKRDPEDQSLRQTATRETKEEVGLTLETSAFITRLEDVRAKTNGFRVAEYVFAVDDPNVPLRANEEVKETLWVALDRIVSDQGKETMTWNVAGQTILLPCVRLGEHVLWGMTLRMVMQLVEAGA